MRQRHLLPELPMLRERRHSHVPVFPGFPALTKQKVLHRHQRVPGQPLRRRRHLREHGRVVRLPVSWGDHGRPRPPVRRWRQAHLLRGRGLRRRRRRRRRDLRGRRVRLPEGLRARSGRPLRRPRRVPAGQPGQARLRGQRRLQEPPRQLRLRVPSGLQREPLRRLHDLQGGGVRLRAPVQVRRRQVPAERLRRRRRLRRPGAVRQDRRRAQLLRLPARIRVRPVREVRRRRRVQVRLPARLRSGGRLLQYARVIHLLLSRGLHRRRLRRHLRAHPGVLQCRRGLRGEPALRGRFLRMLAPLLHRQPRRE